MNLAQINAEFGEQVRDRVNPPFWSDTRRTTFANQALMEAVRRARLIVDSTTPEICEIDYTTDPVLSLDTRIISIRNAIIEGQTLELVAITMDEIGNSIPNWRLLTPTDIPRYYITDVSSGKIRLWPPPRVAGTVLLSVYREPTPLVLAQDIPEIAARRHYALTHGMRVLAYSDEDSETFDAVKAKRANDLFVTEFGPPVSSRNELWSGRREGTGFPDSLA